MRALSRFAGHVLVAVGVAIPTAAQAQQLTPLEAEGRRASMEEAQAARARNDHPAALAAAERALAIQSSPSLRTFIAEENLALGHVAAAFASARLCRSEAERDATLRNREVIIARCSELAAELDRRVGRVRVLAPSPRPEGLAVRVNDEPLPLTLLDTPFPVDPGSVRVRANAADGTVFDGTVAASAGSITEVSVALAAPTRNGAPPPVSAPTRATPSPSPAPWIVVGVGGALAVTGGVFFALVGTSLGACSEGCAEADANAAQGRVDAFWPTAWTLSTVGLGAVAAGVTWALLRPSPRADAEAVSVHAGPQGASVRLRF